MPTLGFVVERYIEIRDFVPENFWVINLVIQREHLGSQKVVQFNWARGKIFDQKIAKLFHEISVIQSGGDVLISRVKIDKKTKLKPLPLTTVQLQKLGTSKLRMTAHKVMNLAEKLYTKGYISYPRTETNQFDSTINLRGLVSNLIDFPDNGVRQFVEDMVNGSGFEAPRKGRDNDHAHPPIHPVKAPTSLDAEEMKVYNLITRHFLACCSKDAVGEGTRVEAEVCEEKFNANGIVIIQKNYLKVYEPFDHWGGDELPKFNEGEVIRPKVYAVVESKTAPPNLLTECDLITTMEKNNIGTDSTIHEHIKTIQERKYAFKQGQYLKPSNLGVSLVECCNSLEIDLAKPNLRAEMEKDMSEIAKGRKTRAEVIQKYQNQMAEIFKKVDLMKNQFVVSLGKYINKNSNLNNETADDNNDDNDGDDGPGGGDNTNARSVNTNDRTRHGPVQDNSSVSRVAGKRIGPCTICGEGSIVVKKTKTGSFFLSCGNYPKCQTSASLPQATSNAEMTDIQCKSCSKTYQDLIFKVKLSSEDKSINKGNYCLICTDKLPGYKYQLKTKGTVNPNQMTERYEQPANSLDRTVDNQSWQKNVTCFKCQQPGHIATNCTNQRQDERIPTSFNTGQMVKKPIMTCSTCGNSGHLSHVCPSRQNEVQKSRNFGGQENSRTMPGSSLTCYTCGQPGHFSSSCPNNGRGKKNDNIKAGDSNCYKCGQPGHYANKCPNR